MSNSFELCPTPFPKEAKQYWRVLTPCAPWLRVCFQFTFSFLFGVRSTKSFRHTRPENCKDVLSIVVGAVNFMRPNLESRPDQSFFVTKFKLKTMFFFTTRKCRCYPVVECLFVFVSCAKKSSSF